MRADLVAGSAPPERASAAALLARATALYDADPRLAADARAVALEGFGGGLVWMRRRLGAARAGEGGRLEGHLAGVTKYGLCLLLGVEVAGLVVGIASLAALPAVAAALPALVSLVLAFYALESRWVFVFPAMAHGERAPFAVSWQLTRAHGGTVAAMGVVLPIAAWMLTGWLRGGALRGWSTGCLAVLLWYRDLAGLAEPEPGT